MLHEGAEQARVHRADGEPRIQEHARRQAHRSPHSPLALILCAGVSAPFQPPVSTGFHDRRVPGPRSTEVVMEIPQVLAGPILRRVEPGSVAVWLALAEA